MQEQMHFRTLIAREHLLPLWVLLALLCATSAASPAEISVEGHEAQIVTQSYEARFDGPSLVYFRDVKTDEVLLAGGHAPSPYVRFVQDGQKKELRFDGPQEFTVERLQGDSLSFCGALNGPGGAVSVQVVVTARQDELLLGGSATGKGGYEGVSSLGLACGPTARSTRVLVPNSGGISLKSSGFKSSHFFNWPIGWEAAMLQVQGNAGGLLVCAFEPFQRFKNLEMTRGGRGWHLHFESENNAPFEGKKSVKSLTWRFRPYRGHWREGARIYRRWLEDTFEPDPDEDPEWTREIRAEFHTGMNIDTLNAFVDAGVDPEQTLIYVPSWRIHGYDRRYPDYTPQERLKPFIRRAHELGFRVMLHVNYFGCHPEMAEYERFKAYQLRQKYSGERRWWEWTRAEPPIKFAYINPASEDWRDLFVSKMKKLIDDTGADALHLDQTLVIRNDKNGLIDGMNCTRGNLVLHRELKEALPDVALSGEGLNEVSMIHEAFAQRHVAYAISHTDRTYDRDAIDLTHPLSAYLFGHRTTPYPYLGTCSPREEQLYLAWRDAYRHWGVIPGYPRPRPEDLRNPRRVCKQVLDEIRTFQKHKLKPAMEGPWPPDVNFPYRSKSGGSFAYLNDRGWVLAQADDRFRPQQAFSRTITGTNSAAISGTVPGWICYDDSAINGLDPETYYPVFPEERDLSAFHVESNSEGLRVGSHEISQALMWFVLRPPGPLAGRETLLQNARRYYVTPEGEELELTPAVAERTGASADLTRNGLFMHPPWKNPRSDQEGQGVSLLRFDAKLPEGRTCAISAKCALREGAVGQSDGVCFRLKARSDGTERVAEVLARKAEPVDLRVNLSGWSGRTVRFDLVASPGPEDDVSFDWGLVRSLQLIPLDTPEHDCRIVWPGGAWHQVAPEYREISGSAGHSSVQLHAGDRWMACALEPQQVSESTSLMEVDAHDSFVVNGDGTRPAHAPSLTHAKITVQGVPRSSIFAHPPDGGRRMLHYFLKVPEGREAVLKAWAGLRKGSESTGVQFSVWHNGQELWTRSMMPVDEWQRVEVPLPAGKHPFTLTLVTDSSGRYYDDWAAWGEPRLVVKNNPAQ